MRFNTVKELIEYLKEYNPEAEVLTDLSFSYFKPQFQEPNKVVDKKTTHGLYIYGEYNPHYIENRNFYEIKSFLIDKYFNKYEEFYTCITYFQDEEDEHAVEYYLKHLNKWDYKKTKKITYEILSGLHDFCEKNDLMQEFYDLSLFIIQGDF